MGNGNSTEDCNDGYYLSSIVNGNTIDSNNKNLIYYRYSNNSDEFTNAGMYTNTCLINHLNNNNKDNHEGRLLSLDMKTPNNGIDYNDIIYNILKQIRGYDENDYGRVSGDIKNGNAKSVYDYILRPILLGAQGNKEKENYYKFWANYGAIYNYWKGQPNFPPQLLTFLDKIITSLPTTTINEQYLPYMKSFAFAFLPWYYDTQILGQSNCARCGYDLNYLNNIPIPIIENYEYFSYPHCSCRFINYNL